MLTCVTEPVVSRDEAVALLFTVSDILQTLLNIEYLLGGENEERDES